MLKQSSGALWDEYDVALLDIDGVVYIGADAVPGAPQRLARASEAGMRLAYVTNNASRPPSVVAEHLCQLGVPVKPEDVVTSAQAAARLLTEHVPPGSPVFVIGGVGLFEALGELGLRGVQSISEGPVAVVSGYHPDLAWKTVIDGAILVRRGLPWVASNMDMTVPTSEGQGPGNGVLVDAVARFAGRQPRVAGKPSPPLFAETMRRVGGERPLVVGDCLDTDIEGAVNVGLESLLVMTGVTGMEELVRAEEGLRPTYISADLAGLGATHPIPTGGNGRHQLNGWEAVVNDGSLKVTGAGADDDWWRIVATAAWGFLDASGTPVDVSAMTGPLTGSVGR